MGTLTEMDAAVAAFEARGSVQKLIATYGNAIPGFAAPPSFRISFGEPPESSEHQFTFDLSSAVVSLLSKLGFYAHDQAEEGLAGAPASSLQHEQLSHRAEESPQQQQQQQHVYQEDDEKVVQSFSSEELSLEDVATLLSAIPTSSRPSQLAAVVARLGYSTTLIDNPSQHRARVLDVLAKLALRPALTILIARICDKIVLDLAARWMLMLGFEGKQFQQSESTTTTTPLVLQTLTALARLLPNYPSLYPLLLILLQHPAFKTNSPFTLLDARTHTSVPQSTAGASSALNPIPNPSQVLHHPDLPLFLLTWFTLLTNVPDLPLLASIAGTYGSPVPPPGLADVMSSHPQVSMRILAWRVTCLWLGWHGPKKEELRRHYVYNPPGGAETKDLGEALIQQAPMPDENKAIGDGEEWILHWPRCSGRVSVDAERNALQIAIKRDWLDAWILDEDLARIEALQSAPLTRSSSVSPADPLLTVTAQDLCPLLVDVQGHLNVREICLPNSSVSSSLQSQTALQDPDTNGSKTRRATFVPTVPASTAMRTLARYAAFRVPTLLSSPPSAGKAAILTELHARLYTMPGQSQRGGLYDEQIVTINLADRSLDAKTLLGNLSSSPTEPGTFVFVEGSLTRSLRHGKWLVLEDIDKAAEDVLCTVAELVEKMDYRSTNLVGGGWGGVKKKGVGVNAGGQWVEAAESFMLFATRSVASASTDESSSVRPATFLGHQYWHDVWLELPNHDEARQIVQGRFPALKDQLAGRIVEMWSDIRRLANSPSGNSGSGMSREVGIRDLMRWCERIEAHLPFDVDIVSLESNPTFQEEVFIEARDVFLNAFPQTVQFNQQSSKIVSIIKVLQEGLNLSAERVDWLLKGRVPELIPSDEFSPVFRVGRARLPKAPAKKAAAARSKPYALTRPFLTLLEKLAVCAQAAEPVLMVGETGTGKTAAVGHLAQQMGRTLIALNLSNQTEASDLLGGFKPVNEAEETERLALDMVNEFVELFSRVFSLARNASYTDAITKAYRKKRWSRLVSLWREAARMASDRISTLQAAAIKEAEESPRKKRKTSNEVNARSWEAFLARVADFEQRTNDKQAKVAKFAFKFVEGPLVKALQHGDWVLLDEVNLATPETLESLSTLLQASDASLVLTERGDLKPVTRHPDFRLFACMNPATDVGKRDLPPALRGKFTEIYVPPPDSDKDALLSIVQGYIGNYAVGDRGIIQDVAEFYLSIKSLAASGKLADGSNQPPHFSMRTLSRALTFAGDISSLFGIRRAVYEGCVMAFTTLLEAGSSQTVMQLLETHLVERSKNPRTFLSAPSSKPTQEAKYVHLGSFWLARGPLPIEEEEHYVLTPSVQSKLVNLARAISARNFPVLIQGPTSSGKTSIVEFLARRTGHRFVRINNHEHTDIQEYLGTYVSDPQTGKLVFREGILVKAVRNGDWIVLDELNLAPTDVLEALNRLLDDNRELVIPETHEVVKPHPNFMLFATQNPPGLYGGRKVLSRAFRNRFLEMHFSDVPKDELETILCEKCKIAPSYAKRIVAVFLELQRRRQATRVFEEKQAFVTLRDLFRWGGRGAVGYEQLALDGYMLLAERTRRPEDKVVVKEVLESTLRVKLDESSSYHTQWATAFTEEPESRDLVWTTAMKRLYVLIQSALAHNEPVLLVGETGSGKTSVCQYVAQARSSRLHVVNCHQNTETGDLLGSQRPIRSRSTLQEGLLQEALAVLSQNTAGMDVEYDYATALEALVSLPNPDPPVISLIERMKSAQALFAWHDGPLLQAMKQGDVLLLDEISLADDSVLERLNSVLEPSRTLVVAEKGAENLKDVTLTAHDRFQVVATMNPGGDYGKKELSPALRNRFTEIWVPWVSDAEDVLAILNGRLPPRDGRSSIAEGILAFATWFTKAIRPREAPLLGTVVTLRDILAWVAFINACEGEPHDAFVHGACMTLVDAIGTTAATAGFTKTQIRDLRNESLVELQRLAGVEHRLQLPTDTQAVGLQGNRVIIPPFSIPAGPYRTASTVDFNIMAPTPLENARKVMRAMQVAKPILLEGSPGVGKTSLVTALAKIAGYRLCRINLSDQTDLIDLFGSDLPVEGGRSGEFAWKDAPFLAAMQAGDWVLLDEMNLASQSVLEGLNSCLDHRGSVYIPELDRSFSRHRDFRIFAAQNPTHQGGSRKGLPRSFVDRFTQVFMDNLTETDYRFICQSLYPEIASDTRNRMVDMVLRLNEALAADSSRFGQQGSPWEMNLRDLLRWFDRLSNPTGLERYGNTPADYLDSQFVQRFRSSSDRSVILDTFQSIFNERVQLDTPGYPVQTPKHSRVGSIFIHRNDTFHSIPTAFSTHIQSHQLRPLQALSSAIVSNTLAIITGPARSGKTALVQTFSALSGQQLQFFHMSPQTDTLEMLGSFEQSNSLRSRRHLLDALDNLIYSSLQDADLCEQWSHFQRIALSLSHLRLIVDTGDVQDVLDLARDLLRATPLADAANTILNDSVLTARSGSQAGRFEWVDGPLVQAMLSGKIFVIENANLCNASVLDRLNALFETNGRLTLTERGTVHGEIVTVDAHPDFRVVMTVDPRHGELSRAMRNRGTEIYLSPAQEHIYGPGLSSPYVTRDERTSLLASTSLHEAYKLHKVTSAAIPSLALFARSLPETSSVIRSLIASAVSKQSYSTTSQLTGKRDSLRSTQTLVHSQDTNDARKAIDTDQTMFLSQLDNVINLLAAALIRFQATESRFASSTGKSIREMSMGEKSRLHARTPGRLPSLEAEVVSLERLRQTLHATMLELAGQAASCRSADEVQEIVAVLAEMNSYAIELVHLASQQDLDYATFQSLLEWMHATLVRHETALSTAFAQLSKEVNAAKTTLILTSGHHVEKIWRSFLIPPPATGCKEAAERLRTTAQSCLVSQITPELCNLYLEVTSALLAQKDRPAHESQDFRKVIARLTEKLSHSAASPARQRTLADGHLMCAVAELELLAGRAAAPREAIQACFFALSQAAGNRTLTSASAGLMPAATGRENLSQMVAWAKYLLPQDNSQFESLHLMTPSLLRSAVNAALALAEANLSELPCSLEDVKLAIDTHTHLAKNISHSRMQNLTRNLLRMVAAMVSMIAPNSTAASSDGLSTPLLWQSVMDSLSATTLPSLVEGIDLEAGILALGGILEKQVFSVSDIETLAAAHLHFSLTLWKIYVPNIPLDPATSVSAKRSNLLRQLEQTEASCLLADGASKLPGGKGAEALELSLRAIQRLDKAISELEVTSVQRSSDLATLKALYRELHQCSDSLMRPETLFAITSSPPSANTAARLHSLRDSVSAVVTRIESIYDGYNDLLRPLSLSFATFVLGLDMHLFKIRNTLPGPSVHAFTSALKAFTSYPSVSSLESTCRLNVPTSLKLDQPSVIEPAGIALLRLEAYVDVVKIAERGTADRVLEIKPIYDQLYALWAIDRKREEDAKAEAESIYRSRKTAIDVPNDEEIEARELYELFPDPETDGGGPSARQNTAASSVKRLLAADDILAVRRAHSSLFGNSTATVSHQILRHQIRSQAEFSSIQHNGTSSQRRRNEAVGLLLQKLFDSMPESIDGPSTAYRIKLLQGKLSSFNDLQTRSAPNFYIGANPAEARRLLPIISKLQLRLRELIDEWPEQMILLEIFERCDAFLSVPSTLPIARILAYVESLLPKIDDWEAYASRETSLRTYQAELIDLIVTWRRLELQSWASLLKTQEEKIADEVAEWWFRFYETFIRSAQAMGHSTAQEEVDAYLKAAIELLQTFFESSPIGQFAERLHLLASFANLSKVMDLADPGSSPVLGRVSAILASVHAFYTDRGTSIQEHIKTERQKIEQEVQSTIKLASWKDVNILALKQSAKKSHSMLYRSVRKLRKLLGKSAQDFLSLRTESSGETHAHRSLSFCEFLSATLPSPPPDGPTLLSLPPLVANLTQTLKRFQHIMHAESGRLEAEATWQPIEDFAQLIIERSESLRKEMPQGGSTEEISKSTNALVNRKRKAWSDLLKELRRIGLPHRLSPTILAKQCNSAYLYSTPPLACASLKSLGRSVDRYFYSLVASLPHLRRTPTQHHDDISSSQLVSAIGSIENCFSFILSDRSRLHESHDFLVQLQDATRCMRSLSEDGLDTRQYDNALHVLDEWTSAFALLSASLYELTEDLRSQAPTPPIDSPAGRTTVVAAVNDLLAQSRTIVAGLNASRGVVARSGLLTPSTLAALQEDIQVWHATMSTMHHVGLDHSDYAYLCKPLYAWMEEKTTMLPALSRPSTAIPQPDADAEVMDIHVSLMTHLMGSVQDNYARSEDSCVDHDNEFIDGGLALQSKRLQARMAKFRVSAIVPMVQKLFKAARQAVVHTKSATLSNHLLARSCPVLQAYIALLASHIEEHLEWHRSLLKLEHVLVSTVLTIAEDGFCKPAEAEEQSGNATDTMDGTGMGSGKGDKNVSNEISGEEQVEGMQDEDDGDGDDDQADQDDKGEKVDMSEDFGGRMEDVNEDEPDDKNDDDNDQQEGDDDEDDDLDDELGDVDPSDPNALDDKFWQGGDEESEDGNTNEESRQQPQQAGEAEMGAHEDDSQKPDDKPQDKEEADDASDEAAADEEKKNATEDDRDVKEEDMLPDGEDEEDAGNPNDEQKPQEMPDLDMDAEALDLPDDLNLDPQRKDDAEPDSLSDLDMDEQGESHEPMESTESDEPDNDQDSVKEETVAQQDETQQQPPDDDASDMQHTSGADTGVREGDTASSNMAPPPSQDMHDPNQQQSEHEFDGATEATVDDTAAEPERGAASSNRQQNRGQRKQQEDSASKTQDHSQDEPHVDDSGPADDSAANPEETRAEDPQEGSERKKRDLGDVTKEWMRRLDAIPDAETNEPQAGAQPQDPSTNDLEFTHEGQEDEVMQAAGAADEDEAQQAGHKMDENAIVEDFQALDVEEPHTEPQDKTDIHHIPSATGDEDVKNFADAAEVGQRQMDDMEFFEETPEQVKDQEVREDDVDVLPSQLQHWLEDGRSSLSSSDVWRMYQTLTRDLSYSLTESLRLILEPTLATRLKGDYRTGKRLNMKKIIPYIASDFTKDKIWLRRTRPSQREYQIVLALDDSHSMAGSHSVHLAYQTLALVTQAFARLEVGEVAVSKFGKSTQFVHGFEDGHVTETAGSKIVDAFTFTQDTTDIKTLLEQSLQKLSIARENRRGSAADLWQMEIIISDGFLQETSEIRALLRKAMDQKVMIVFLVIDSLHSNKSNDSSMARTPKSESDSILSMKTVSIVDGNVQIERYMDTFPFDYYVVLRDVEALPDVLSETLRQFFERVSGDR